MDKIRIHSLAASLFTLILALLPAKTESDFRLRPLPIPMVPPQPPKAICASQFSLVNSACAMLPFSPLPPLAPPPSPLWPPAVEYESRHRHREHGHGHRHRHRETPDVENCCRWVKLVDSECVCEMLVHFPVFLSKPIHAYTVVVDETCNVTYTCGGQRLRP